MKYIAFILLLNLTNVSLSIEGDTRVRMVKLYYPNYYFFDNFKPHIINIHPFNLGLSYASISKENRKGYHVSFDRHVYLINKWLKSGGIPGNITDRRINFLSFGIDRSLMKKAKLHVDWFSELNLRWGTESFWFGTFAGWEPLFIKRKMRDIGASFGGSVSLDLPWNFILSLSAKQSVYFFRYYNLFQMNKDSFFFDKGTPVANWNFNIKLGYRF